MLHIEYYSIPHSFWAQLAAGTKEVFNKKCGTVVYLFQQ